MNHKHLRNLTIAAMVAALYVLFTWFAVILGLASQPIQLRFSEALCILPYFTPAAIPGLTLGCLLFNLTFAAALPLDMVVGSLATLAAALWTSKCRRKWLAPLPPVVCNAVIVGAEIALLQSGVGPAFWPAFAMNALTVGLGELVACGLLGGILLVLVPRNGFLRERIPPERR